MEAIDPVKQLERYTKRAQQDLEYWTQVQQSPAEHVGPYWPLEQVQASARRQIEDAQRRLADAARRQPAH